MADVQDGARGPRGNGSAVELQLENVARALGEDIDHAQIHECGTAHIIFDPQISGGPRKQLKTCGMRGGPLREHDDMLWNVNDSGLWLHIKCNRDGAKVKFWDPHSGYTSTRSRFYTLVAPGVVKQTAKQWRCFRKACLASMELPRLQWEQTELLFW